MTRKRKRPVLTAPLGPKGRAALAARVAEINSAGEAARDKLAASTGRKAGKAPAARVVRMAAGVDREVDQAERRWERLIAQGAYADADRVQATLAGLYRRQRRAAAADLAASGRRARLDRFALLVSRSSVLTDWHRHVADRWLEAVDAAADGLMQRAAEPDGEGDASEAVPGGRDPVTGQRRKPDVDGAAIFLSGRSVLDRWAKAVPVADVLARGRKVPQTFDPKPVKRARGQGGSSVQDSAFHKRSRAEELDAAFADAVRESKAPAWTVAVAIRVIRQNEGVVEAMKALGVSHRTETQKVLHIAIAIGLLGAAEALGMAVDK